MLPTIFRENLFDDFFMDPFEMMPAVRSVHDPLYGKHVKNIMKTDVKELADSFEMDIDLPGFKKDEVKVELKDGNLTITATKGLNKDQKDEEGRYIRRERYSGTCARSFYVGDLRREDISARFEDGILRLTLPKLEKRELPESTIIAIE